MARAGDRSVVTRAYASSPLRLLTPRNHGSAAWIYTSSYGGGFVDGDRVEIDVEVGAAASAFLSSQAATKVYRSPRGTSSALRARIAAGGLLVVAPDPVVCFAGARYGQTQRFQLHADAALVVVDWLAAGRYAAGERWAFREYHGVLEVCRGERVAVYDAIALRASDGSIATRMGRFNVIAAVLLVGAGLDRAIDAALDTVSRAPVVQRGDLLLGGSRLREDGCLIRIAGVSMEQTSQVVRDLLAFLPQRLGDDPWRRKW